MPETIRAKFVVDSVTPNTGGEGESVQLHAVYSDDPSSPNHTWSKYTPNGHLAMTINNPATVGFFKPGQEYYLDIIPAGEAVEKQLVTGCCDHPVSLDEVREAINEAYSGDIDAALAGGLIDQEIADELKATKA